METFIEIFEQIGLTATMLAAFGWYIVKKDTDKAIVDKEIRERHIAERDMLIQSLEKNRVVNETLLNTNKELSEAARIMLNEFSNKINNIENSVIEIKNKISN